jgi:hypothetical protein
MMADADLRPHDGTLLTPARAVAADLLIRGESICAIVEPTDPTPAASTIDVAGLYVLSICMPTPACQATNGALPHVLAGGRRRRGDDDR